MSKTHDPREGLTHDIVEGQVYGDKRQANYDGDVIEGYDERLRLVYVDDERVLLRSNDTIDRGNHIGRHHYRCEHRETFEKNAGAGRYQLLEEPTDPPRMPTDGVSSTLTVLKRLQSMEQNEAQSGGGRKSKHRLEAFTDAIEAISEMDPTSIDWSSINGVGNKTAENLNEAGFETDVDVQSASDEQLLDVGGVGSKNLENIKEVAGL